jgi:hypothetical protein
MHTCIIVTSWEWKGCAWVVGGGQEEHHKGLQQEVDSGRWIGCFLAVVQAEDS